uniref:Uncharacterized protein n=1 Tax=Vitis vinifera TaxID=29760 RepID=F6HEZ1_VITVI
MIESVGILEGEVIRRCGSEVLLKDDRGVIRMLISIYNAGMGTKVQCKSYLPGYYSMRDLNEDSNSGGWPLYYGDKTLTNGQYYNGFLPRAIADAYTGYDKDVLKQTMLEHEAIFKDQVHELHRLYRKQRNLMDEIKRKELHKQRVPVETSLSSSPLSSQMPSEEARKWHIPGFPLINSVCASPSVSGTENSHHPLSFIKGNSSPAGPVQFQNGGCSKDCEVLESRPTKLRRKMFNLQLPADEYIDTEEGEQFGNNKLFLGSDRKTCRQEDVSKSNFCLRSTNALADLNEPVQAEEAKDPASVDFLGRPTCHGETQDQELSAKPKSEFLDFPKGSLQNSHHGSDNGTLNNLYGQSKGNGREWLPYMLEAGHGKSNPKSNSQGLQPEKLPRPSQPGQVMLNKAHEPPAFLLTDQNKGDMWRERTSSGLEISEKSQGLSNYNHAEQAVSSHLPSQCQFVFSSDLAKSWSHSVSSWEKMSSGLSQKSMSIQTQPFLTSPTTLSKSLQSSAQIANRNGFYHGSSSGSKELPIGFTSIGFDYLNCTNGDSAVSGHLIEGSAKYSKGSNCMDVKSAKDMNLNMVLSNTCKNEASNVQNLSQNVTSAAYACDVEAKEIEISDCPRNRKILGFPVFEKPHVSNNESYSLTSPSASLLYSSEGQDIENNWKNRALDINLPCDLAVPDLGKQTPAEVLIIEKGAHSNVACVRSHIDLNSCITEDDASMTPVPSTNVKIALEIDLEAPVVPETEEDVLSGLESIGKQHDSPVQSLPHKDDGLLDEFARIAAEAIVAISSSGNCSDLESPTHYLSEAPLKDSSLHWFVEVISSCADDLDSKFGSVLRGKDYVDNEEPGGIDYFEAMTLKLIETNVDEYLPEPVVPENSKVEETGTALVPNRTRKGQARRGRQRRDFQRDILPGLASLSRHEVTEDLQTFGGLMRATGHPWHSGLARRNGTRNGGARGRRRSVVSPNTEVAITTDVAITTVCSPLVQQLTNIEMGLEDRSLTGWGKTTRRPRRQRCPTGNLPPPLT